MPWLDIILLLPLIWGMYRGFRKGFIIEVCTLMALVLGVYGAAKMGGFAGGYLHEAFNTDEQMSNILAFALVFIGIVVVVFLFGKLLESVIKMVALGLVNKLAGMAFGGAKFALIISSVLFVMNRLEPTKHAIPESWKEGSYSYDFLAGMVPKVYPVLKGAGWDKGWFGTVGTDQ